MKSVLTVFAATAVAATAGLTGCSGESQSGGGDKKITIAAVRGWDDTVAASLLWERALENEGYDVTVKYNPISVDFVGLAEKDFDLYMGAWLPRTHADYWKKYKDKLEKLTEWNDEAKNVIAVNENAPVDSLAELNEHAEAFGGKIYGIEPGAGLMQLTKNKVMKEYGLDNFELVPSSTPAMLSELKRRINEGKNVAVTLWQPHWAYAEFPIKNLKDPKQAFGKPDHITTIAREGFSEDYPKVTKWIKDFEMGIDKFSSLQNTLFTTHEESKYDERLDAWIADHKEWFKKLTKA